MKIHKARVIKESIESLGANGVAFSVICCEDPKTIQRHTIHLSHLYTDEEMIALFQCHAKNAATAHLAAEHSAERAVRLAGEHTQCEVCGK